LSRGLYIQFQGLPTEEYTEDLIIPEVMGNHVHEYVEAELKKKVFEFLWSNGDDENVQNKLMYWKQESADKFSNAMTAAKFEGMGGRWWKRWQQKTKKEHEFINNSLTENKHGQQTTTES
jgi:REP element-mobilizing transposase RayT